MTIRRRKQEPTALHEIKHSKDLIEALDAFSIGIEQSIQDLYGKSGAKLEDQSKEIKLDTTQQQKKEYKGTIQRPPKNFDNTATQQQALNYQSQQMASTLLNFKFQNKQQMHQYVPRANLPFLKVRQTKIKFSDDVLEKEKRDETKIGRKVQRIGQEKPLKALTGQEDIDLESMKDGYVDQFGNFISVETEEKEKTQLPLTPEELERLNQISQQDIQQAMQEIDSEQNDFCPDSPRNTSLSLSPQRILGPAQRLSSPPYIREELRDGTGQRMGTMQGQQRPRTAEQLVSNKIVWSKNYDVLEPTQDPPEKDLSMVSFNGRIWKQNHQIFGMLADKNKVKFRLCEMLSESENGLDESNSYISNVPKDDDLEAYKIKKVKNQIKQYKNLKLITPSNTTDKDSQMKIDSTQQRIRAHEPTLTQEGSSIFHTLRSTGKQNSHFIESINENQIRQEGMYENTNKLFESISRNVEDLALQHQDSKITKLRQRRIRNIIKCRIEQQNFQANQSESSYYVHQYSGSFIINEF